MTRNSTQAHVQFSGVATPDMDALNETLIPYGRLSDTQIAIVLPVEVHWPKAVEGRIAVLEMYCAGGAPSGTPPSAIDNLRSLLAQTIPAAVADIVNAVRQMSAAAIQDDGSRAVALRSAIVATYLEAKAIAMTRTLDSYVLETEDPIDWGNEFRGLGRIYSPQVIYGLAVLARNFGTWAGWTDADLHIADERQRVWTPILADVPDHRANREFTSREIQVLFIPQLLDRQQMTHERIRAVAFGPSALFSRGLIYRDEQFVDRESCADQTSSASTVARIAADRILKRLAATPARERSRTRAELTLLPRRHGLNVSGRVHDAEASTLGASHKEHL